MTHTIIITAIATAAITTYIAARVRKILLNNYLFDLLEYNDILVDKKYNKGNTYQESFAHIIIVVKDVPRKTIRYKYCKLINGKIVRDDRYIYEYTPEELLKKYTLCQRQRYNA